MSQTQVRHPRAYDAVKKAALEHQIKVSEILGTSTHWRIVQARRYAAWLMRNLLQMSYPEIGFHLNKDHSSVITMLKKLKEQP